MGDFEISPVAATGDRRVPTAAAEYEPYYGFAEPPFALTPDPGYLFLGESHAEAFELLQHPFEGRQGVLVITGDAGTGKTTLCRARLARTDRTTFVSLLLRPLTSPQGLLEAILRDWGVVSAADHLGATASESVLMQTLGGFLLALQPLGARAVLILDDAHALIPPVLAAIQRLPALVEQAPRLLQVVLAGEPALLPLLQAPGLESLNSRVAVHHRLRPLSEPEVAAYVRHRLEVARAARPLTFTDKALQRVHEYSGGLPRTINTICERALVGASAAATARIDPAIVDAAARTLGLGAGVQARRWWKWKR